MKMYISLFRIRLINNIQYRAIALGAILSNIVWAFLGIVMYCEVYKSANTALPMDFSQTVSYMWMQRAIMLLLSVVGADGEIFSVISDGTIAYELVRPMSLYGKWYFQAAANRVAVTAVNCLPMLIIAFLFPVPYRMSLPDNFGQFILFLISLVLALGVVVAFSMLMFISLFYTVAQRGIKIIVTAVTSFLSGGIIPLPFFPKEILGVIKFLPFSAMQNVPLLVYSGNIKGVEAIEGIVFQIVWLIILVIIGQLLMRRSLKKVVVLGG